MLASLLPGIREIRTALVVGYIWIVAVWLAFVGRAPKETDATGLWDSFYDARSAVSAVGIAIGVSFIAWIVGALWIVIHVRRVVLSTRLYTWAASHSSVSGDEKAKSVIESRARVGTGMYYELRGWWLTKQTEDTLLHYSRLTLLRIADQGRDAAAVLLAVAPSSFRPMKKDGDPAAHAREFEDEFARLVFAERQLIIARLLGTNDQLHDEIDRLDSEAALRAYMMYPAIALVLVVAFTASLWVLPLAFIPGRFARSARPLLQRRNDLLIDAVVRGDVEPPIVGRMRDLGYLARDTKVSQPG